MRRHIRFGLATILFLLLGGPAVSTEKSTATQLIELAKTNSPALKDAINSTLDAKESKGRNRLDWARARLFLCDRSNFEACAFD